MYMGLTKTSQPSVPFLNVPLLHYVMRPLNIIFYIPIFGLNSPLSKFHWPIIINAATYCWCPFCKEKVKNLKHFHFRYYILNIKMDLQKFCAFNIAENWFLKVCDRLKTPKMASGHYWKVQKKFDKNSAKNECMLWDFFRVCVSIYDVSEKPSQLLLYYYLMRDCEAQNTFGHNFEMQHITTMVKKISGFLSDFAYNLYYYINSLIGRARHTIVKNNYSTHPTENNT